MPTPRRRTSPIARFVVVAGAVVLLAAGCASDPPTREFPAPSLASVPPGMTEIATGYFAYALPADWELVRTTYGRGDSPYQDADGTVVVTIWYGRGRPDEAPSTVRMPQNVAQYLHHDPVPAREPVELPVVGQQRLDVARAEAWQRQIQDDAGHEHTMVQVHIPERPGQQDWYRDLKMLFFNPDPDTVAQVTATIVAENRRPSELSPSPAAR